MKTTTRTRRLSLALALATVAIFALNTEAYAATVTWNVAGDGDWDTTSNNWTGGSPDPNKYVNGDTAQFTNTAGGTISIAAGILPGAINVNANTGTYTFNGNLGGTTGITKLKGNTLILSGTNTYSGVTKLGNFGGQINVVRAVDGIGLSPNSNLQIDVGVFESSADIVRAGGSGGGQMRLNGVSGSSNPSNGFSAFGGPINVAFGSLAAPTALTWGSGDFRPSNNVGLDRGLILNHSTADNTLDFKNAVDLGGSLRVVRVDSADPAAVATMSGVLSGTSAGGLRKSGVGKLVLSADNTYLGATTVTAGALEVNGMHAGAGDYTVEAGATLGGTGTIGGNVTVQNMATIAPGTSPGTLTMDNLTLDNGSTYEFEAGDLLAITNTLTLNDDWTLELLDDGTPLQDGGMIELFTYGNLAGGADLMPTIDDSMLSFTPSGPLSLTDVNGTIFLNGVSAVGAAAVPEPSAIALWSLIGLMLSGYGWLRRRKIN